MSHRNGGESISVVE